MNKFLIYIGEDQCFDLPSTVKAITALDGVFDIREGVLIGAVFECKFSYAGKVALVRISEDLETVSIGGAGVELTEFAIRFQKNMQQSLHMIDMNHDFDLDLSNYESGTELMAAILQK